MRFRDLAEDDQLRLALELCKEEAETGKDSFFDRWWYFDTNCLSKLVKLSIGGHAAGVSSFLANQDVLLTSTSMQELSKAPDLLRALPSALGTANLYLAPDIIKFWYTDILNFLNVDRAKINSLQVYQLQPDLIRMITTTHSIKLEQACLASEEDVASRFHPQVTSDIGADLDERDLCVYICGVINDLSQEWFDIGIPPADCNAANFAYSGQVVHVFRGCRPPVGAKRR